MHYMRKYLVSVSIDTLVYVVFVLRHILMKYPVSRYNLKYLWSVLIVLCAGQFAKHRTYEALLKDIA